LYLDSKIKNKSLKPNIKLQYNIITSTYYNTANKYISKKNKTTKNKLNIILSDTILISNKLLVILVIIHKILNISLSLINNF
jgi:hypothetical protein